MAPDQSQGGDRTFGSLRFRKSSPPLLVLVLLLGTLAQIPVVSAHGESATFGLTRWHGIVLVLGGALLLAGSVFLKRSNRIPPTTALYGVFLGVVVAAVGGILFEGLSPDPTYTVDSMPFPRSWYQLISSVTGALIVVLSFLVGWLRWPARPRYTFLGMLMGFWVVYPALLPGQAGYSHPVGYAIVLATPVFIGYIIWKDVGDVLRGVLSDPVARRFGIGVGLVVALFFMATSGYLSFFWEEGAPHETTIVTLPVLYQLVMWPTLEVALPQVPLFFALSLGVLIVVGSLGVLVGLNAAVIASYWRAEERAGTTQGATGTAAVVGACTCGCCGPLVSKIVILAAGPAIAAPLYWLFVDPASPLSSVFIIGSIVLFTGTLVYSAASARPLARSSRADAAE